MEANSNELLLAEIRNLTVVVAKLDKHQSVWYSFVRGIMSGLGYFVGAAFLVGIVIYFLQRVDFVPIIGSWLGGIIDEAVKNSIGKQLFMTR